MPNSALAGTCSGSFCTAKVTKLYITTSGTLYIGTSGDETKLDCKPSAGVYITLKKDAQGFDAIYASLLAYQLSGDSVTLRIENGSENCILNYAVFEKSK